MKNIVSIFIIIVLLNVISIISYAGSGPKIEFLKNGDLKFELIGTKATTGIRYSTIGWQIFDEDKYSINPRRTYSAVLKIDLDDESNKICENIGGYPEKIKTTFLLKYDMIIKRIREENGNNPGWADKLLIEGGDVYLDPVYTIKIVKGNDEDYQGSINDRGEKTGEVYYSLSGEDTLVNGREYKNQEVGIKEARGWSHPDDFKDDYNKKLTFPSFKSKVIISHMTKNSHGNDVMMPKEEKKEHFLNHNMSETFAKKAFAGYKYDSLTIQMDQNPIETKSDESIKITGKKNKYKAEEYKEPEEGSFKEATVIFYYTPVDVAGTHQLKAEPDSKQVEGDKIGQMSDITIDLTQGSQSIEDWKFFVGDSHVQLTVNLKKR